MNFFRSKRGLLVGVAVVLLALFMVRPGAGRLKERVVRSLSLGLGRRVEVESVSMRLLPRPGFELHNFVVHDDPAFGAEPMLRAQQVSASLRLISLLRGRIEISRLNLAEPSLNLAHDFQGHWNLEDLLLHADRTPVAPTGKKKTESRPAFPYIQADRARINFKFGSEKKPYALTEADFGLWQDSENQWGMRLQAKPVRTDFNLSDTGTLKVTGNWQRAGTLRDTPLQFNLEWSHAQLGQASKLAYGSDQGWRGGIVLSATVSGTPGNLLLAANFAVQDFRRFGVLGGDSLRLAAQCGGRYSSVDHSLWDISCRAPVGSGLLSMEAKTASLRRPFSYDLRMTAQDLPIATVLALVRHCRQGVAEDLVATGTLNGQAAVHGEPDHVTQWHGGGSTEHFQLGMRSSVADIALGKVPFSIIADPTQLFGARKQFLRNKPDVQTVAGTRVEFGPVNVAMGRPSPAHVRGSVSRTAYEIAMQGSAEVQSLLQLARTMGVTAAAPIASGAVNFDLRLAGNWGADVPPRPVGEAQLRSIRAEIPGINQPVEIIAANLSLKANEIQVQNLALSLANSSWRGNLSVPLHCLEPAACVTKFNLHSARLDAEELNEAFNPRAGKRPWYRFLASSRSRRPYLLSLNAKGKLAVDQLIFKNGTSEGVSTNVEWNRGELHLAKLQDALFGGTHSGDWKADFTVQPPQYTGNGTLEQINLEQLSALSRDTWITGTASGHYHVSLAGLNASDLIASVIGSLQLDISDGSLPRVELSAVSGPLEMQHFDGSLSFHDNKFEIGESKLETQDTTYQVTGTASMGSSFLGQALNVKLVGSGVPGFNITGTLNEPRVAPAAAAETQAALKP